MTESTALAHRPSDLPSESDYDAICAAVMETERGRWFLAEYAKRNRQSDTLVILSTLERMESRLRENAPAPSIDRFRVNLMDMAQAISRTKSEIAAIKPDAEHHGRIGDATEELDAIVKSTEVATSAILSAAEKIQETAWTMREQGVSETLCDDLDGRATEIYTACSFQDLTGQRIDKVIKVMDFLEKHINAMIDIWGAPEVAPDDGGGDDQDQSKDGPLAHGLDQSDIDMVMGDAHDAPDVSPAVEVLDDVITIEVDDIMLGPDPVATSGERETDERNAADDEPRTAGAAERRAAPVAEPVAFDAPASSSTDEAASDRPSIGGTSTAPAADPAPAALPVMRDQDETPRSSTLPTARIAEAAKPMRRPAIAAVAETSSPPNREHWFLSPARAALLATMAALTEDETIAAFT